MISFFPATKLMVKNFEVAAMTHSIMLTWDQLFRRPIYYKLRLMCRKSCQSVQYNDTVGTKIGPYETLHIIENLKPASNCSIWFHAVYNEASLDEGIYRSSATLSKSKMYLFSMIWLKSNHYGTNIILMFSIAVSEY